MWTPPRLTGALRAFGNVTAGLSSTEDARLGKDLAERKALALQEQSKTCVSWAKISEVVRSSTEIGKKEAEESLKELLASAKAIGRSEFGCLTPSLPCIFKWRYTFIALVHI